MNFYCMYVTLFLYCRGDDSWQEICICAEKFRCKLCVSYNFILYNIATNTCTVQVTAPAQLASSAH